MLGFVVSTAEGQGEREREGCVCTFLCRFDRLGSYFAIWCMLLRLSSARGFTLSYPRLDW